MSTEYPKTGGYSKVRSRGDIKQNTNERLASRMMLSQSVGSVLPERRAMNDYALQPRDVEFPTNPRNGADGTSSKVVRSGIASRGNVIHSRYLKGVL